MKKAYVARDWDTGRIISVMTAGYFQLVFPAALSRAELYNLDFIWCK